VLVSCLHVNCFQLVLFLDGNGDGEIKLKFVYTRVFVRLLVCNVLIV